MDESDEMTMVLVTYEGDQIALAVQLELGGVGNDEGWAFEAWTKREPSGLI